ncbi:MAG: hypothetical protein P8Y71_01720 [Pseudolabrys sp.]
MFAQHGHHGGSGIAFEHHVEPVDAEVGERRAHIGRQHALACVADPHGRLQFGGARLLAARELVAGPADDDVAVLRDALDVESARPFHQLERSDHQVESVVEHGLHQRREIIAVQHHADLRSRARELADHAAQHVVAEERRGTDPDGAELAGGDLA